MQRRRKEHLQENGNKEKGDINLDRICVELDSLQGNDLVFMVTMAWKIEVN